MTDAKMCIVCYDQQSERSECWSGCEQTVCTTCNRRVNSRCCICREYKWAINPRLKVLVKISQTDPSYHLPNVVGAQWSSNDRVETIQLENCKSRPHTGDFRRLLIRSRGIRRWRCSRNSGRTFDGHGL